MEFQKIIYEKTGGIAKIKFNRPGQLNSLDLQFCKEFLEAIKDVEQDDDVKALIITGTGKGFCAGGDINMLVEAMANQSPMTIRENLKIVGTPILLLKELNKPVIAAINGVAVGAGFDMLLQCDIRICADKAKMGATWIKNAIIPVLGGLYLLPRIVGITKATEMVMTGDLVDAEEALKIGLVNKVVPLEKLDEEAEKFARRLVSSPTSALAMVKRGLNRALDGNYSQEMEYALYLQTTCMTTKDFSEALNAFLEKRPASFTGK